MFIISVYIRASDNAPYSQPRIQLNPSNGDVYITRFRLKEQMSRGNMDEELGWFGTTNTVLDGLAIDRNSREKVLKKIGSQIYEMECRLNNLNTSPISYMTRIEARARRTWIRTVYRQQLANNGLTEEFIMHIVEPVMAKLWSRMIEVI